MTAPLTDEKLQELLRLADAASTGGEWHYVASLSPDVTKALVQELIAARETLKRYRAFMGELAEQGIIT